MLVNVSMASDDRIAPQVPISFNSCRAVTVCLPACVLIFLRLTTKLLSVCTGPKVYVAVCLRRLQSCLRLRTLAQRPTSAA